MARYEFTTEPDEGSWIDRSSRLINLCVRALGMVLLLVGFAIALMVIANAWSLYQDPAEIERFARAVEQGSNLDLTLASATARGAAQLETGAPTVDDGEEISAARPAPPTSQPAFRFSYFVAWLLAIMLLLLIGRLSIAAIRTGGELALYDVKIGRMARALMTERLRLEGREPRS